MNQHAHRNHHSTETMESMEYGKVTGTVLLNFSAAFDLVDHNLLLMKLNCYKFSVSSLDWIKSYLTGRTSMMFINGAYSQPMEIECGVP